MAHQKARARAKRVAENKVGRQKLPAQFIEEASKLHADAPVRDRADASAMAGLYALISQMRMVSNATVVEKAEAVIRTMSAVTATRKIDPDQHISELEPAPAIDL